MGILSSWFSKSGKQQPASSASPSPTTSSHPSAAQTSSNSPAPSPAPIAPTLAQLEAELQQASASQVKNTKPIPKSSHKWLNKLIWTGVLLGIPAGAIAIANLPYPAIRQPVAKNAPILLVPSYMEIEANYKKALANIEEARQLIESPTSPQDLDRGSEKLKEGKTALDAIPLWFVADWAEYSSTYRWVGYDWRFSPAGLQSARVKVGQLEAKVFQEQNAQQTLVTADRGLTTAKSQYQQTQSATDRKIAVQAWQAAIDQLAQIPSTTLAGKIAQQKVVSAKREFQEIAGLLAGNERTNAYLTAGLELSTKAAELGRNPPHSADRWREISTLWEQSIRQLEQITPQDPDGYKEAQRLLSEYRASLIEVRIRIKNEEEAIRAVESANRQIADLWRNFPTKLSPENRNRAIASLFSINAELEKVKSGTTIYLKARELQLDVQQKLKELQKAP
ncbi:hypothetical protein V2H45_06990 [Tumidithrix elongata RA019]|uniref:Chromosome segregation ATPase n=1 Tax=Tumidithrix elongata BACA0141 TaxID=2716417 RepID=A0AAW9PZ15_9CYAN|nr:hypothetical protein [Tumidithrix elongata RA019]